jgi:hypothetical protein
LRRLPAVLSPSSRPTKRNCQGRLADGGHQLEQGLVDAAQLLGVHVGVVGGDQATADVATMPGEGAHGIEQRAVVDQCRIQVGALLGIEEPAQGRERQQRLPFGQAGQGLLERQPEVMMARFEAVGLARRLTQQLQAVALAIALTGHRVATRRVEQVAGLGTQQEEQPIDQAQELLVVGVGVQLAVDEALAQGVVLGVGQEAIAQGLERLSDTEAQLVEQALALLLGLLAPLLQPAGGLALQLARLEAAGMEQQP